MAEERRILVVKLSSLGDTLHALPAAAELRDRLPARVDWAVQPAFAPLVRAFSCVDRVFEIPRPSRPREWARALLSLRRAGPWDLVVDFQGLLKSALVSRAAPAPRRIGPSFAREGSRLFYTELAGRRDKSRHAVDECFDVLRRLGVPVPAEPRFPLSVPAPAPDALDPPALAGLSGPRVAVAPYSRWPSKNWPAERFSEAIRLLVEGRGARVHVLGGPGDRAGAQAIVDAAGVPAANHCGEFSLVESAGLLSRCEALLTNDSGPMHLAAALGVRCVAVFGPTSAARTGPYGPRHAILRAEPECPRAPCRRRVCPLGTGACLASVSAARAVAALFPRPAPERRAAAPPRTAAGLPRGVRCGRLARESGAPPDTSPHAMKKFIHDDFLLSNRAARELFHGYAEKLPIIDYHCHLPPAEIAGDKRWANIAEVWLGADHYKWRVMRTDGVDERFVTGDAPAREKFQKFAEAMPHALRNPMYHWCHLELARYFGIDDLLLSGDTAEAVWERANAVVAQPWFSARGLVSRSNVEALCTTDDPGDTLEHHAAVAADKSFKTKVLPAWRPDKGFAIGATAAWNAWVDRLAAAADADVATFDDFLAALRKRHAFFAERGCRISDYGLNAVLAEPCTDAELRAIFAKARGGAVVTPEEEANFRSRLLVICGEMDAETDWTWQLHFNALRNNSTRIFRSVGPDAGVDSIGDWPVAAPLARILDELDAKDRLPRTILYSLNPRDNEMLVAMAGNFVRGPVAGKVQVGSAWWFNDQMDGMLRQLEAVSQLGLLHRFVGMLTDSRSFLSYTRHEYFRRILCDLLGRDMERGVLPDDLALVGSLVRAVCHDNAAAFFGL